MAQTDIKMSKTTKQIFLVACIEILITSAVFMLAQPMLLTAGLLCLLNVTSLPILILLQKGKLGKFTYNYFLCVNLLFGILMMIVTEKDNKVLFKETFWVYLIAFFMTTMYYFKVAKYQTQKPINDIISNQTTKYKWLPLWDIIELIGWQCLCCAFALFAVSYYGDKQYYIYFAVVGVVGLGIIVLADVVQAVNQLQQLNQLKQLHTTNEQTEYIKYTTKLNCLQWLTIFVTVLTIVVFCAYAFAQINILQYAFVALVVVLVVLKGIQTKLFELKQNQQEQ